MQTQNPWTLAQTVSDIHETLYDDEDSTNRLQYQHEWDVRCSKQHGDPLVVVIDDNEKWSVRNLNPVTLCQAPRPAKYIPLPPQAESRELDSQFIINPVLTYDPHRPRLRFDMSLAPIEPHVGCFGEAATYPSLPSLTMTIPSFPWVLVVHHSLAAYVTVGDVLNTLWTVLQTPLDGGLTTERQRRRIDLLLGKHRFMGLSLQSVVEEVFTLHCS